MSGKAPKKKDPHSHAPRNKQLAGGVWRYGRYVMNQKRRFHLKKNKSAIAAKSRKRTHYKIQPITGEKNGGTRLVQTRKSVSPLCHFSGYTYVNP